MYHYKRLDFRERKTGKYHFSCVVLGKSRHDAIKQILDVTGYPHTPVFPDREVEVKLPENVTEDYVPEKHNNDPLYYFTEGAKYSFNLVEAPGSLEGTIAAITQSHIAILCIPSDKVEEEFEVGGNARRDLLLLSALKVEQVLIVLTNIDNIYYHEKTYKECLAMCDQMIKVSGIPKTAIVGIDVDNANMRKKSDKMPWAEKTLIEYLDWFDVIPHNNPMYDGRMAVANKGGFGIVDSGYFNDNQEILVNDKKAKLKIKRVNSKLGTKTAYGGEAVEFDVDGADINVGDVICNRDRPVKIEEKFTAKFMLLENIAVSEKPKMKLHMNGAIHDAYIDGIQRVENPTDGNLSKTVFYPYRGECFIGRLQCDGKFYYEHHKEFYKFAKFVITEGNKIMAVGTILPISTAEWAHQNQR